jgi:uncharacterized protein YcfJ
MREPGKIKAMREQREAVQAKQQKRSDRTRSAMHIFGALGGAGLGLLTQNDAGVMVGTGAGAAAADYVHKKLSNNQFGK